MYRSTCVKHYSYARDLFTLLSKVVYSIKTVSIVIELKISLFARLQYMYNISNIITATIIFDIPKYSTATI